MKFPKLILSALALALVAGSASADFKYVDGKTLRIVNRAWDGDDYPMPFNRIPKSQKKLINNELFTGSYWTAGVAIRFATNSRSIGVKYELYMNTHMNHQAPTGTKGVDLYILEGDSVWRHVNTLRPEDQRSQQGTLVSNMNGGMHEFMLYLPTYDGISSLSIGIDETATITKGNPEVISEDHIVVAYGSSILQGGCASRTGMIGTTILSRELNCQVANLGFSGQATLVTGIDKALANSKKLDAIIVDPIPNCDYDMLKANAYTFLKSIREAHPDVPLIMVEGPYYPYYRYDSYFATYLPQKNGIWHDAYIKLLADNPDNLYYIDAENLDGEEDDGTVDGIHLTDLGFRHYADKLLPTLRQLVKADRLAITAPASHSAETSLTPTITWSDPSRNVTVQISSTEAFLDKDIVYQCSASGGSCTVPRYVLGGATKYYLRLEYKVGDMTGRTAIVDFTTKEHVPDVPAIATPANGGTLYANHHITVTPVDGATGARLEVSASETFPARSCYVSTVRTDSWADGHEGSEIRIGTAELKNGTQYFARVRCTYNTASGSANTEYSPVVKFTYSSDTGVTSATAGAVVLSIDENGTAAPRISLVGEGRATVELYSLDGVHRATLFNGSVDGSALLPTPEAGTYLVAIAGQQAQKLIVR